jgi:hypothetical protein
MNQMAGAKTLEASLNRAKDLPRGTMLAASCTQEWDQWQNWDDTMSPEWGDVRAGGQDNW